MMAAFSLVTAPAVVRASSYGEVVPASTSDTDPRSGREGRVL